MGGGWLGDAEDGGEPVGSGDGDVGDEGFDEGLALVAAAGMMILVMWLVMSVSVAGLGAVG